MVKAEGVVTDYPLKGLFKKSNKNDTSNFYEEAAHEAREKCFVGKTISGNVTYEVGTVQISN